MIGGFDHAGHIVDRGKPGQQHRGEKYKESPPGMGSQFGIVEDESSKAKCGE
jgi:hypothetical protein